MKILEILAEKILDSKIFEQSFRRRDVESKITEKSYQVILHLIKLLKWNDQLNYSKHVKNVNSWLSEIQLYYIKGNKKPTQSDYFQWMFSDVMPDEPRLKLFLVNLAAYRNLLVIRSDTEVFDILKNIMYQLSFDLQTNSFTTIENYLPDPIQV